MITKSRVSILAIVAILFLGASVWWALENRQSQSSDVSVVSNDRVASATAVVPTLTPKPVLTETPEILESVSIAFLGSVEPGSIGGGPSNGEIPYLFEVHGVDFDSLTREDFVNSIFSPLVNEKGGSRYGWGSTNERNVFAVYMPQSAQTGEYVVAMKLPDGREAAVTFEHRKVEAVVVVVNTPTPTPTQVPAAKSTQAPEPQSTPTPVATQAVGSVGPPNSGPPNTPARIDPLLGPMPAGSTTPVVCGGGALAFRELRVPSLLTDEEQEVFVSIAYLVPARAVDVSFIGRPGILVVDSSPQFSDKITGADVLAVFPNAGVNSSDNMTLSLIAFPLPVGANPVIVDGKPHTISWTFMVPTEEAYDTRSSHNGIDRLSAIWTAPFQLDHWMFVMLQYTVDGVRYQNSHGCF